MVNLAGRAALVTGGGSGIGRETARRLAAAGANVIVADRDGAAAEETCRPIEGAAAAVADVTREADVRDLVAFALERFGRLDLAHNNAGIGGRNDLALHEYDAALFDRELAVNLRGVFLCLKHELAHMRAAGGGAIVNTASEAGLRGGVASAAYTAAKHGVIGLTRSAAIEVAELGIRVNAVAPGLVETPMTERAPRQLAQQLPMRRFGQPAEIADAVVWLLSDQASFVTGQVVPVDGGWSA